MVLLLKHRLQNPAVLSKGGNLKNVLHEQVGQYDSYAIMDWEPRHHYNNSNWQLSL